MTLTFVALRSALFAAGFLWLWTWVGGLLRRFDDALGGLLPAWSRETGLAALAIGGVVAIWCIGVFVVRGHGTPALFDAPRRLVALGPYRYVRNPMYIGGALLLLGYGLYQQSPSIVLFVPVWWLLFHLLVILYEEATLRRKFGPDYDEYCRRTPRWIPRSIRPASAACVAFLVLFGTFLNAAEQKPNFSGEWPAGLLHPRASSLLNKPAQLPEGRLSEVDEKGQDRPGGLSHQTAKCCFAVVCGLRRLFNLYQPASPLSLGIDRVLVFDPQSALKCKCLDCL